MRVVGGERNLPMQCVNDISCHGGHVSLYSACRLFDNNSVNPNVWTVEAEA